MCIRLLLLDTATGSCFSDKAATTHRIIVGQKNRTFFSMKNLYRQTLRTLLKIEKLYNTALTLDTALKLYANTALTLDTALRKTLHREISNYKCPPFREAHHHVLGELSTLRSWQKNYLSPIQTPQSHSSSIFWWGRSSSALCWAPSSSPVPSAPTRWSSTPLLQGTPTLQSQSILLVR